VKIKAKRVQKLSLIVIFAVAIILPATVLGILALRAIEREEAYIEKNLKNTLDAEVANAVNLINAELKTLQNEIAEIITIPPLAEAEQALKAMKQKSSIISIPFLVSSHRAVIYPNESLPLSEEESLLVNQNKEMFEDKISIPVYKNIIEEYKETILNDQMEEAKTKEVNKDNAPLETDNILANEEVKPKDREEIEKTEAIQEQVETQKALTRFKESEPLRKKIYKQAQEQGQQILARNIILPPDNQNSLGEQWSFFILESRTFSQIIARNPNGFIPRFIEDKLYLLYWEKDQENTIAGCVIDNHTLRQRLLKVMPSLYTENRIISILDEKAVPLLIPKGEEQREWPKPFIAREISELLPRWEIAAYLTDPQIIKNTAQSTAIILWTLIALLLISLFIGGSFIIMLMLNEIKLAQQKTSFVANVSHELKTPLTSIRLFSELLRENRQPDKEKRKRYLDIMVSETERLTRLINNVLDFSRLGKGKKNYNQQNSDIVGLGKEIIEDQRARLEHNGFTLSLTCPDKAIFVHIDQEALKQVLINLLSNAEKYSQKNKSIKVKVEETREVVKINILDRGPGIPLKLKEKIFKEFYRIDDSLTAPVSGSGLGLTISRKIIRDHGGDILYFRRNGGGSNFQIIIPKGEKEDAEAKNTHRGR
jgi:signal transduction histidine kinase